MNKKDKEETINELKTRIKGVMNSYNIYYDSLKSAEERLLILKNLKQDVESAIKALRKNFKRYRKESVTPTARLLLEAIQADLIESGEEVSQFSRLQPKKSFKGGKPKTPKEVCIVILDAFDKSERSGIDTDWIRELLSAQGEIRKTENQIIVNPLNSLPITPTKAEDKQWAYKLKESLLRSLLSGKGVVTKKKDATFRAKEEAFYKIIWSKKWQKDWRSCLNEINATISGVEKKKAK